MLSLTEMGSSDHQRRYEQYQHIPEGSLPTQDDWETSFDGALHTAVDTLFTYRPIVERLTGNDATEAMHELVRERKLLLVERLRDTAWEEVTDLALDLKHMQTREQVIQPTLMSAEVNDPYEIAWNLVTTWQTALQQLGQMSKPSDLKEEEDLDDYHDELNRLYRRACGELRLPWPPPARSEERPSM